MDDNDNDDDDDARGDADEKDASARSVRATIPHVEKTRFSEYLRRVEPGLVEGVAAALARAHILAQPADYRLRLRHVPEEVHDAAPAVGVQRVHGGRSAALDITHALFGSSWASRNVSRTLSEGQHIWFLCRISCMGYSLTNRPKFWIFQTFPSSCTRPFQNGVWWREFRTPSGRDFSFLSKESQLVVLSCLAPQVGTSFQKSGVPRRDPSSHYVAAHTQRIQDKSILRKLCKVGSPLTDNPTLP
ncbi:unnamed protein product [Prorocentrum cordatum]|uniref:Uncharacterized protein n=1 Tax=Prorocentrum cordatum TaxID=2364126 RepID=A0ABN9YAR7_9DINO|nr:unnamed protein product [Polarella glacialis]